MDNVAIVTGVSRGLGEALVVELLQRGWRVLGIGRHDRPHAVPSSGARYRFVAHDLADAAGVSALAAPMRELAAGGPAAAVLINNAAAAGPVGVFGQLDAAEVAASLQINLAAPAALANVFCTTFTDARCDRRIVNISSGAAERTLPGGGVYCVAKAGLEMLTRVIAAEHVAPTLRVITLRPGIIDTEMQTFMRTQPAERLPSVGLFKGFHESRQLVPAQTVAQKTIDRLIEGPIESGRTYSYAEL